MDDRVVFPSNSKPSKEVLSRLSDFLSAFAPYELGEDGKLHLFLDEKSGAFYLTCHLLASVLVSSCDSQATLDTDDDDEIYKLNRDVTEDTVAYQAMERDAVKGRTFEDLVLEYDTSYLPEKPLKVYGGQHRLRAVSKALTVKGSTLHGVRVYFALSREQKVEIATINNTAVAVPNDLLDRMREQLLGSDLRDWCQKVGLLEKGKDFADRRHPDIPTVRLARTLLLNYYLGKAAPNIEGLQQPVLCKSGGVDEDYIKLRDDVEWSDDKLLEMGKEFVRLHKEQRDKVSNRDSDNNAEYARKAFSLSVVASWAYAAGLFQGTPDFLKNLYSIPDNVVTPDDPLNAKALSQARLKGTDPDTYRGLGTRNNAKELGRMLEVFLVLASKGKKKITKDLANAAIQSYEAKRAVSEANKSLERI